MSVSSVRFYSCATAKYAAMRLERFTRGDFPRILLDPARIPRSLLSVQRLQADLRYLAGLVNKNAAGFTDLVNSLDDPAVFRQKAQKLGLTERDFVRAGGGWAWLVLLLIPPLLTGCDDDDPPKVAKCGVSHPSRLRGKCIKDAGHGRDAKNQTEGHKNKEGDEW
jgi:hypothetical protein